MLLVWYIYIQVEAVAEPSQVEVVVDEKEIEERSKIYFNLQPGSKMFEYHSTVNKASKELALLNPALLTDRKVLFEKARLRVHNQGFNYKKKKSRSQLHLPQETTDKKQRMSGQIRNKRMKELGEDIGELEVEMRLQMQQREKYKNINDLTKAITSTEKLSELRNKKRQLQDELTVLQMKDAHVKKSKKSLENRKSFDLKGFKKPSSFTIDSFFKQDTCSDSSNMNIPVTDQTQNVSESVTTYNQNIVIDNNTEQLQNLSQGATNQIQDVVSEKVKDQNQNIVSEDITSPIQSENANNNFQ